MEVREEVLEIEREVPKFKVPYMAEVFEPEVSERRLWNHHYTLTALFAGGFLALLVAAAIPYFEMSLSDSILFGVVVLLVYAVMLFFLLEPGILREVRRKEIEYRDVPGPVQEIVKEVVRNVPVERPVYFAEYKPKLEIPKYAFVGSDETKTFHKRGCRFSRLIKNKYKVSGNSIAFFKARRFHECDACFPKKKRKR